MARFLVTGGAGFIGSHFVDQLLSRENTEKITVLDSLTYAGNLKNLQTKDPRISFVHGNICDRETVENLVKQADYVINFAAESHVDRSILSATEFMHTNVLGTQILLSAALKYGVVKFVQVSTDEVYGSISEGSWDENSPLLPNSPYSASKASADLLVRAFHKTFGLNTNITRCSNNFGPRQYPEKIIPFFINKIQMGQKLPIYGNGQNVRDWLHVEDHCAAIEMVLNHGESGETYNIGGGFELSNLNLAKMLLEIFEKPFDQISYVQDRKGHDFRYSVDWSKIHKSLGYKPRKEFASNLTSTVDWYLKNPNWWQ
jgi:dTDP-glucose 4,6-dehydratase